MQQMQKVVDVTCRVGKRTTGGGEKASSLPICLPALPNYHCQPYLRITLANCQTNLDIKKQNNPSPYACLHCQIIIANRGHQLTNPTEVLTLAKC